jgi:hypothetical protein
MIKKYGIGLVAVAIAITMAAFTAPKKSHVSATHVFEFNSSLAYTVTNVSNSSNWQYVGETSQEPLCDNTPDKACRLAVTDAFVNNPSNPTALSGMTISASTSGSGDAYVTGITDETDNVYSNQAAN